MSAVLFFLQFIVNLLPPSVLNPSMKIRDVCVMRALKITNVVKRCCHW